MKNKLDLQKIADELDFDLEDVEMLVEVFIESAEESLIELKEAIDSNDYDNIFKAAHAIKGSSANLTLMNISDVAKNIELQAREKNDADYHEMYTTLRTIMDEIK